MNYFLSVTPADAILGQSATIVFRCIGTDATKRMLTFEHKSLVVEWIRHGSSEEPNLAFPNHRSFQVGERLVRIQSSGGIEELKAGEERARSFNILELYPVQALDLGEFDLSYRLEDAEPPVHVSPVRIRISSHSRSVPFLIDLLGHESLSTRTRASNLLHRMTARGFEYDPNLAESARNAATTGWHAWWKSVGTRLRWDADSDGATIRERVTDAAQPRNNLQLGGVVYEPFVLSSQQRTNIITALDTWNRTLSLHSLEGENYVSDREFAYPPETTLIICDDQLRNAFGEALGRLASITETPEHVPEAMVLLATIGRMPHADFVRPLAALSAQTTKQPDWARPNCYINGLLDFLDPRRVPVGQE